MSSQLQNLSKALRNLSIAQSDGSIQIMAPDLDNTISARGFTYRRLLTLDFTATETTAVSGTLLLIQLNSSNFDFSNTQSDGSDIYFSLTPNGSANVSFYRKHYDQSGEVGLFFIWLSVCQPITTLYMFYGDSTVEDYSNAASLWLNFLGVWFFDQTLGSVILTQDELNAEYGAFSKFAIIKYLYAINVPTATGTFTSGETCTFSPSGATGVIQYDSSGIYAIANLSGVPTTSDTVTASGGWSGAVNAIFDERVDATGLTLANGTLVISLNNKGMRSPQHQAELEINSYGITSDTDSFTTYNVTPALDLSPFWSRQLLDMDLFTEIGTVDVTKLSYLHWVADSIDYVQRRGYSLRDAVIRSTAFTVNTIPDERSNGFDLINSDPSTLVEGNSTLFSGLKQLEFDGSAGIYLDILPRLDLGDSDFTVFATLRFDSTGEVTLLTSLEADGDDNKFSFVISSTQCKILWNNTLVINEAIAIPDDTDIFVALTRDRIKDQWRAYVNGYEFTASGQTRIDLTHTKYRVGDNDWGHGSENFIGKIHSLLVTTQPMTFNQLRVLDSSITTTVISSSVEESGTITQKPYGIHIDLGTEGDLYVTP